MNLVMVEWAFERAFELYIELLLVACVLYGLARAIRIISYKIRYYPHLKIRIKR